MSLSEKDMTLKTLKDIEVREAGKPYLCYSDKLRKEAIEWVKAIKEVQEKGETFLEDHGKIAPNFKVDIFYYEQDDSDPMIRLLKYFFNIEESELK